MGITETPLDYETHSKHIWYKADRRDVRSMVVVRAVEKTLEDVADLDGHRSFFLFVRDRVVLLVVVLRVSVAFPPHQAAVVVEVQMRMTRYRRGSCPRQ